MSQVTTPGAQLPQRIQLKDIMNPNASVDAIKNSHANSSVSFTARVGATNSDTEYRKLEEMSDTQATFDLDARA